MTDTNNTDGAALLPVTQADRDAARPFVPRNSIAGQDPQGFFDGRYDDCQAIQAFARHRIATQEDAERSEIRKGFAPCPTCRQYSHSIGDDALAKAFMHFEAMTAHPLRGHPMGHIYDDATRDAAQVLIAAAKGAERSGAGEDADSHELSGFLISEKVDRGVWSLEMHFGSGDAARDKMRAVADTLRASTPQRQEYDAAPAQEGEGA